MDMTVATQRPPRAHKAGRVEAIYMEGLPESGTETEPMGIVISRGRRTETAPRVSAYVWSAAPDGDTDTATRAA